MDISRIVSELRTERQHLDSAIKAIEGIGHTSALGARRAGLSAANVVSIAKGGGRRRPRLSAEARRRISEAQKRRWAKIKKAA